MIVFHVAVTGLLVYLGVSGMPVVERIEQIVGIVASIAFVLIPEETDCRKSIIVYQ